jgi:contact-dependent growth inhibition (CDI) system CdiI-like immunity protein
MIGRLYDHSFPYLDSLIGGWFHQDLDIYGDTLDEVIAAYRQGAPVEDWMGVRADIHRFLRLHKEDQLTEQFGKTFHHEVDPELWEMTTRQWLLKVDELLQ